MSRDHYQPTNVDAIPGEAQISSKTGDISRHHEAAAGSETFLALQERLRERSDILLDTGYDMRDGAGLVAKLDGPDGGEVMFFEWDGSGPSARMIELGIQLAEKLKAHDTLKLGPTEDDSLLHTPDPERVVQVLSELGIEPSEEVEPPSQGYKRSTIRFLIA